VFRRWAPWLMDYINQDLFVRASPTRVPKTHTHTQNSKISSPTNNTQNPFWVPTKDLSHFGRNYGSKTHNCLLGQLRASLVWAQQSSPSNG